MRYVLASLIFGTLHGLVSAADWPQWRGPTRDCQITAQPWPDSLDETHLVQGWTLPLGPGYSGPIVVGDRVFVTETRDQSHEVVRALDRQTGDEIWKTEWPGSMSVPFFARENGSWIRSTPSSDGSHLYVTGIRDLLVCLDTETGQELWRLDLVEKLDGSLPGFGAVCSPLIDGEHLYIQAGSSLVKLNRQDGTIVWRTEPESAGLLGASMNSSPFSSPVIATLAGLRQAVVQSRKSLFGVDLESGRKLWSTPVEAFRGMNILTPLVNADSVFTSTYGGGSFVFDVTANDDGFAVKQRWQTKKQGYMSSPVMIDQHVYMHLRNQRFTCIDPRNGETKWTTRPFGKYWSTVVNGEQLLALDQNGTLNLILATPTEFRSQSTRRVSEQETWAHLAVSDDQMFVRDLNGIAMWTWN